MKLTNKDYLDILKYYNINSKNMNKKQIKSKAEFILSTKLCRCIKKIPGYKNDEKKAIAICKDSVLKKKGFKGYGLKCKGKSKLILSKKYKKNKINTTKKKVVK